MRKLLILLAILPLLHGCAAVLVGGGATGGYLISKDERTIGQITDDATITTKVKTKYLRDKQINSMNIHVKTYDGVVTLEGTVPSQQIGDRVTQLARNTNGVKKVQAKFEILANNSL